MFTEHAFRIAIYLLILWAAPALGVGAQESPEELIIAAWIDNGALFIWESEDPDLQPMRGLEQHVWRMWLSPDGQMAVVVQSAMEMPDSDPRVVLVGVQERTILDSFSITELTNDSHMMVMHAEWADATTFYFNTAQNSTNGILFQNDLYRIDVLSREIIQVLSPGEGGAFAASPDGQWIALVRPGVYETEPGSISMLDVQSGELRQVLTFDGVSSGSSMPYYPKLYWTEDSRIVRVAIPYRDLLYVPGETTGIWEIGIDGVAQQTSEINASYFGLPAWSEDGTSMLHWVTEPGQGVLLWLADGQGNNGTSQTINAPALYGARWAPDSRVFYYNLDGDFWMGSSGETAVKIQTNPPSDVQNVRFISEDTYLIVGDTEGNARLSLQWIDGRPSIHLADVNYAMSSDEQWDAVIVTALSN